MSYIKMLEKFGRYEQSLDKIGESLNLSLGLCHVDSPSIRFNLSEHSGYYDILWRNPAAMKDFDPKDKDIDSIHISEIVEKRDVLDMIMKKYRLEIQITASQKMCQARRRALKVINFLFKEWEDIYIVIQGDIIQSSPSNRIPIRYNILKGLKYLAYNLKGPKRHSSLISVKYPYKEDEDDPDSYFRILFRHRFSDIRLNSLLKKMIYYCAWEEIYFISARDPRIAVNVYDHRGMNVTAPLDMVRKLQQEFNPWVRRIVDQP